MITDPESDHPKCGLCGSKEHEHIRRGESCAERLVEQRERAQMIAVVAVGSVVGMVLTYASVILLFFR